LTLQDDAKNELNKFFKSKNYPYEIQKIFFYRLAFHESHWDNYEPITNINRLYTCNLVRINVEMTINCSFCEYNIKYKNDDENLICEDTMLKYFDFQEKEDFNKVGEEIREMLIPIVEKEFPYVFKSMLKKSG